MIGEWSDGMEGSLILLIGVRIGGACRSQEIGCTWAFSESGGDRRVASSFYPF